MLEKFDSLRTHLTPDSEDQITLEILHVSKELAETFAIFYQPRFQSIIKPLLRKSSVSKLNRFYNDLYEILGDGFSLHLNLPFNFRSNTPDTSLSGVLNNGHQYHSNSTTNNYNNNVLQLKLPSSKNRQQSGDKKHDGSISSDLKAKEETVISNSQNNETNTVENKNYQFFKHCTNSSLGQITFTPKWHKKKTSLKHNNVLNDGWKMGMGSRPLIRQLNKRSRNIHKSLTLTSKRKRNIITKRKLFLTLLL